MPWFSWGSLGRQSSEDWLNYSRLNMERAGWFAREKQAPAGLRAGQLQTLLLDRRQMARWEGWLRSRASVCVCVCVWVCVCEGCLPIILWEGPTSGGEFSEGRRAPGTSCPFTGPERLIGPHFLGWCSFWVLPGCWGPWPWPVWRGGPAVLLGVEQVVRPLPQGESGCSETVLSFKTKGSLDVKENAGPNFFVYSWWVTSLPFTFQRVSFSGASEKAHC